jgi:ElaB/YqjD/DUF883 family membrane-anchored ribosome-binding protein
MMASRTWQAELEAIRAEIARLREGRHASSEAAAESGGVFSDQFADLNRMVQQLLADAEETVAEHPVATVAGALALGIVIGRLTAR